MYGKINEEIIGQLKSIVGENNVITCLEEVGVYANDEYVCRQEGCQPEAVVRPGKVEDVSAILKLASEYQLPVTPRGGGTGLAGGCVPIYGGVVLSFQRMNKFLELDRKNQVAVVESGLTLGEFIRQVEAQGFYFPLIPEMKERCLAG